MTIISRDGCRCSVTRSLHIMLMRRDPGCAAPSFHLLEHGGPGSYAVISDNGIVMAEYGTLEEAQNVIRKAAWVEVNGGLLDLSSEEQAITLRGL